MARFDFTRIIALLACGVAIQLAIPTNQVQILALAVGKSQLGTLVSPTLLESYGDAGILGNPVNPVIPSASLRALCELCGLPTEVREVRAFSHGGHRGHRVVPKCKLPLDQYIKRRSASRRIPATRLPGRGAVSKQETAMPTDSLLISSELTAN